MIRLNVDGSNLGNLIKSQEGTVHKFCSDLFFIFQ